MIHAKRNGVVRRVAAALGLDSSSVEEKWELEDGIDGRSAAEVAADIERLKAERGPELARLKAYVAEGLAELRWKSRQVDGEVATTVPARLDRMPWTAFHANFLLTLAVSWAVIGLQVALAAMFKDAMTAVPGVGPEGVKWLLVSYLVGTAGGVLAFGRMADRLGRRSVRTRSLALCVAGASLTPFAWDFWSLAAFLLIAGAGIGGEYAGMAPTIQEVFPKALRGRMCLAIHASFWLGAAAAALGSMGAFDAVGALVPGGLQVAAWQVAYGVSAALCVAVLFLRRWIPESPRWLAAQGSLGAAERIVDRIERLVPRSRAAVLPDAWTTTYDTGRSRMTPREVWRAVWGGRRQVLLCFALMSVQAAFYNAFFFGNEDVLLKQMGEEPSRIGWHVLAIALSNFAGPVLLGAAVDRYNGRKRTMALAFLASGMLLLLTAVLFGLSQSRGLAHFGPVQFTLAWMAIFFFASAGASTAYLSVGELFPLEFRAQGFAGVFALSMVVAGIPSSYAFEWAVKHHCITWAYMAGAGLMIAAAIRTHRLSDELFPDLAGKPVDDSERVWFSGLVGLRHPAR